MVQAGIGGLDTPRTNLGDATYLSSQQLDFDISQEQSFQSPSKDNNNLLQQLQNGRRGAINLKTPRSRAALGDRRNLPAGLGGGEFTPLLKSATRNSALQNGKENVPATPAFLKPGGLDNITEDMSPLPNGSSFGESRNGSYMAGTPMPQIDSSSAASTPMALLPRRNEGPGVLQDGNQLSLREQENVIDKIEKENFGLKLKIHFLEEALRKAGPGFSEAALKENTELKVDKVTMQKELSRFRKTLASAEKDVDIYRQQFIEMQEKVKRKMVDQDQRQEVDRLRQTLEERDAEVNRLKSQEIQFEDLHDTIDDLKADLREKDRLLDNRDDELENFKDDLQKRDSTISDLQNSLKDAQRKAIELEENAQVSEELEEAKETIEELEQTLKRAKAEAQDTQEGLQQDLRRLEEEAEDAKDEREQAIKEKQRAEADLEELQEEIANKSMTTKGRSRQIEEKANRLQDELESLREKYDVLEEDHAENAREIKKLNEKLQDLNQSSEVREQKLKDRIEVLQKESQSSARECEALLQRIETTKSENFSSAREREALSRRLEATQTEHQSFTKERETLLKQIESLQNELYQKSDEKNLLQIRHDALTAESASLQRDLARSEKTIEDLEDKLDHEKTLALDSERQLRDQYKNEINRLNDQIETLQAQLEEVKRDYDGHTELSARERKTQSSQIEAAEAKAASLQRTIDRLQEAEGSLSTKESKLKQSLESEKERHTSEESLLHRQIQELQQDLDDKFRTLENNKDTMLGLREELRTSQREQKMLAEKVEGLEDEVEILQTSLDDESEQANNEIIAAKKESETLRQQIRSLKDDLVKAEFAAARTQAEIESFQGDLQAGEGSKQQLSLRLREVESQLTSIRKEKLGFQDQLANLQSELQSLRTVKADVVAERDELQSQLRSLQQQGEETFRLDQERVELRSAKMKLDGEIRRLREENKATLAQQEAIEHDLQQEIDRAGAEEARLNTEIGDLQRILRGSSEKKELAVAKKTIQKLEARIQELETQAASADGQTDVAHELSIIRHDLSSARQKETEFLQREATQKDVVRTLKRQITDLERKVHEVEVSRFVSSPHSSIGGSARKSEIVELRAQLATAHQTLKAVRSQLKEAEKEASKRWTALNIEIQAQRTAWDSEKDELEHALDEAELAREELEAKNATSEAVVTRLRSKIDRLEKALTHERQNTGEDRSIVAERRDLHEMLRETQLQAESLEIVVQERDHKIAAITSAEQELRAQLKRVRDERALHRSEAVSLHEQLENMERKYKKAKDKWSSEKKTWETQIKAWEEEMTHHDAEKAHWDAEKKHWDVEERHWELERQTWLAEKKNLTRGVRFANMSLSINEDAEQLQALKLAMEEREKMHVKEMRGRAMQLEWLRAKCQREENFRDDAAYAKRYMGMQIDMYRACNETDIRMLEAAGIKRPPRRPKKRPTLRLVATAIIATVRMQMGAAKWAESRKISDRIEAKIEQQRIQALQLQQKEQEQVQTAKKSGGKR
ncbi:related to myosin heavy chain [Rhynchosporium secalis]|uniref:Related to myosin heavy chain n=1 Tax=Rhynchosporium secalis TaxID=38038 RepID=A0A1E1M028_RHYSE|nr:related to myosin heavy chain [Rhynchosporium secalis]